MFFIPYSKLKILIIFLTLTVFLPYANAASDSAIIRQEVTGTCNNNGVCEAGLGENSASCLADCPLPTVSPPAGGGGVSPIFDTISPTIQNLSIQEISAESAKVLWKTNEIAACQLFLGLTEEYEIESFSEDRFFFDHSVFLDDLFPDNDYYFKIACLDANKNKSEIKNKFRSLPMPDTTPPVNVSDFRAEAGDAEVYLSWQNPEDADFQLVKLFRSESFFPKNSEEGKLIYEGKKSSFLDKPLENDKKYYYTIFAFDFSGNFSSGAAATASPKKIIIPTVSPSGTETPAGTPGVTITPTSIIPTPTSIATVVPIPTTILSKINELNLEDFIFSQEGVVIDQIGEKIEVDFSKPIAILVDAGKIPEEVGAIMLILSRDDETFSFLFKLNAEKNQYETVVKPLHGSAFLLTITVLDKKNGILKAITGQVTAAQKNEKSANLFSSAGYFYFLFLIILAIILIILYYLKKKNKKKTETYNE